MQRFLVFGVLLFAACAPSAAKPSPASPVVLNPSEVTCKYETPTGSHFERRMCRSGSERNKDWREAFDMYYDVHSRKH